jgi:hypothetical protein
MREEPTTTDKCRLLSVQKRSVLFALALLVLSGLSACGGDSSPTAPSGPAQVEGLWTGTSTLNSVTGGECVGSLLSAQGLVWSPKLTVTFQQSGSSLTATVTETGTATICTYSGSASTTTISLNMQSCKVGTFNNIPCPNNVLRDIQRVGAALTGTVDGNAIGGTTVETWDTFVGGTTTATGSMVLNSTFSLKRGPSLD